MILLHRDQQLSFERVEEESLLNSMTHPVNTIDFSITNGLYHITFSSCMFHVPTNTFKVLLGKVASSTVLQSLVEVVPVPTFREFLRSEAVRSGAKGEERGGANESDGVCEGSLIGFKWN